MKYLYGEKLDGEFNEIWERRLIKKPKKKQIYNWTSWPFQDIARY